jgi:hypothetical protein
MRQRAGLLLPGMALVGGCTMLADIKCTYELDVADAGSEAAAAGSDASSDAAVSDAAVFTQWSEGFGDSEQVDEALSVAIDKGGNIVLTGYTKATKGSESFKSVGDGNVFVYKLDASGKQLWEDKFQCDEGHQVGTSVATDSAGNIILTGNFDGEVNLGGPTLVNSGAIGESDIFVVKLNADGVYEWSKSFGGAGEQFGASVAIDHDDNIVLTGSYAGDLNFGGGALPYYAPGRSIYVAKLGPGGGHIWSQGFYSNSTGEQFGRDVAIDIYDDIIVVGQFSGSIGLGMGVRTSNGGDDIYIAKLHADQGTLVWENNFGGMNDDHGISVATDNAGDIVLTGSIHGPAVFENKNLGNAGFDDIVAVKLADDGTHMWSKSFGGSGFETGMGVAIDGANNIVLTGHFGPLIDFGGNSFGSKGSKDIFLAKFASDGMNVSHVWSKPFGDKADDVGNSVATDIAGNTVLAGRFQGMIDFESKVLTSAGNNGDIFVATFPP